MGKSATYTMEIDGKVYPFNDDDDLTLSALRQIKSWFPAIGTYVAFRMAYLNGDPEALACVRWIVLRRAGVACKEPNAMDDFSLGEFMNSWLSADYEPCTHCGGVSTPAERRPGRGWTAKPDAETPDPTSGATEPPILSSSTATPTSSADAGSEPSEPSAT